MTEVQEKFIKLLKEMFQFDQADLDFGIYKIMNAKHDEIEKFLNEDLPNDINEGLASLESSATSEQIKKIEEQIAAAKSMDLDPAMKDSMIAKLEEQKAKLNTITNLESAENEIYNNLLDFFSRYYDEGDFISQRRYSKGKYAIPYEGEEVKLHWANADQYYIKTSEYFKDYTFSDAFGNKVHFKILDAETEQNNNKSKDKKFFQLTSQKKKFEVIDDEFYIYVEYKAGTQKTQKPYNAEIIDAFSKFVNTDLTKYQSFASIATKEKGQISSLLEKQLTQYTAKNSFDYFIHKNLRGFLNQELDFFIKNEVIRLDDIDETDEAKTKLILTKAKVLRIIAKKIIAFLAQLEDFQKKLFLKKKFVTETNYCITLDRIDESFYEEIATNEAQRKEWVKLFAIDEIKATSGDLLTQGKTAYSEPLTVQFLKENPFLVLDTAFFTEEFKEKLVASIDDFDEKLDGQLIHGDNFQALNLLKSKYTKKIDCCYIDPPYNTEKDKQEGKFLYKDNFDHSSWLSFMENRISGAHNLLSETGSFFCSCDENEIFNISQLLNLLFSNENFVENITWNKRIPKNDKGIGNIHEYILLYNKDYQGFRKLDKSYVMKKDFIEDIYALLKKEKDAKTPIEEAQKKLKKFYREQGFDRGITLYCELDDNYEPWGKINMSWPNGKTYGPRYDVINPVTGKISPVPDRGWRWAEDSFKKAMEGKEFKLPDGSLMKGKVWFPKDEKTQPSSITYLKDVENFLLRSIISIKSDGGMILSDLGLVFDYPKTPNLISRLIYSIQNENAIILDYFGGSATTAQSVIELNREDNGSRNYILCEMGEYFDIVTKPRVEKVIYSKDWEDGKPVSREGSSHAFKYIRLESYEDTLNNITLNSKETDLIDSARKDYFLNYMMDFESKDSDSLLNIEKLAHPFNYEMNITRKQECKKQKIDLVETFNYLIGLNVTSNGAMQSYDATFTNDASKPVAATLKNNGSTYRIKMIEGTNRAGERVLVIWRDLTGDIEKDNAVLDAFFAKKHVNPLDFEYKTIYVNGDNNLQNVKTEDENWKVVLIESEMKKRMFSER